MLLRHDLHRRPSRMRAALGEPLRAGRRAPVVLTGVVLLLGLHVPDAAARRAGARRRARWAGARREPVRRTRPAQPARDPVRERAARGRWPASRDTLIARRSRAAGGRSRSSACPSTAGRDAAAGRARARRARRAGRDEHAASGNATRRSTPDCPELHLFEREIAEQCGVVPQGHPSLKPVRRHAPDHAAAARSPASDAFDASVRVHPHRGRRGARGRGRPGARRHHRARPLPLPGARRGGAALEIVLGYQHRGVERLLETAEPRRARCSSRSRSPATA